VIEEGVTFTFTFTQIFSGFGTVIILGLGARKLELLINARKEDKKKAIYGRLSALESASSSQSTEITRVDEKVNNLRDGCKTLESETKENTRAVERTTGNVETIMKLVKVNKNG